MYTVLISDATPRADPTTPGDARKRRGALRGQWTHRVKRFAYGNVGREEAPMRCENCGRVMKSAELWRLATDPKAPTSRSMRQMCWDCRLHPASAASARERAGTDGTTSIQSTSRSAVIEEAYAIVSAYEATLDANQTNTL